MPKLKYTTESFIVEANKIHNEFYNYEFTILKNLSTKIKIICPIHGIIEVIPEQHLDGRKCKRCSCKSSNTLIRLDKIFIKYIEKCKLIHKNKYDYSLVNNKNNVKEKVPIICIIHGIFYQSLDNHSRGTECIKCTTLRTSNKQRWTIEHFIQKANEVHNFKYTYSNSIYVNYKQKLYITCSKHGDFLQNASNHLLGKGCPTCKNESNGEKLIREFLEKNNIEHSTQKTFDECFHQKKLRFDFFIPNRNLCIEYDGKQHFLPLEIFGGEESFKSLIIRDNIKNEFCNKNNINLIRFNYKHKSEIIINKLNKLFSVQVNS